MFWGNCNENPGKKGMKILGLHKNKFCSPRIFMPFSVIC